MFNYIQFNLLYAEQFIVLVLLDIDKTCFLLEGTGDIEVIIQNEKLPFNILQEWMDLLVNPSMFLTIQKLFETYPWYTFKFQIYTKKGFFIRQFPKNLYPKLYNENLMVIDKYIEKSIKNKNEFMIFDRIFAVQNTIKKELNLPYKPIAIITDTNKDVTTVAKMNINQCSRAILYDDNIELSSYNNIVIVPQFICLHEEQYCLLSEKIQNVFHTDYIFSKRTKNLLPIPFGITSVLHNNNDKIEIKIPSTMNDPELWNIPSDKQLLINL